MNWMRGAATGIVLALLVVACGKAPVPPAPPEASAPTEASASPEQAATQPVAAERPTAAPATSEIPEEFRGAPPEVLKAIAGLKLPRTTSSEPSSGEQKPVSDATQAVPEEFRGAPPEVLKAIAGAKLPPSSPAAVNPTSAVPDEFKGAPADVVRGLVNVQQGPSGETSTALDALASAQNAYGADPNAELEAQAMTMMMTANTPGAGTPTSVPASRPVPPPAKKRPATPPADLPPPTYPSLLEAVKAGAADDVENHILRGAAMDVMDKEGRSALYLAIKAEFMPVVNVLLDYGADPNLNSSGDPDCLPLVPVLARRQWDLAKRLRERGATEMPHVAAASGDLEALKELAAEDPAVFTFMDPMQHSLAYFAAAGGGKEVLAYLLANGVPMLAGRDGYTPYLIAAIQGCADVVHYLVEEQHVDPNERGPQLRTALHSLVELSKPEGMALLKEVGVDLDARDQDGLTALNLAMTLRSTAAARRLIELGASLAVGDAKGRSPLHMAVSTGSAELVGLLLDHGADIEAMDAVGDRPVHTAARGAQVKLLALLLGRGAHLDVANKEGLSPMHCAAQGNETIMRRVTQDGLDLGQLRPGTCRPGRLETIDALLEHGLPLSAASPAGTPLLVAAASGQDGVIAHLLAKGVSIEESDTAGRTALDVACMQDRPSTVRLLLSKKADPARLDASKQTAVHHAAALMNTDILQMLLGVNAGATEPDAEGRTPLHVAAEKGSASSVQILIASRAKLNAPDKQGQRPLHLAAQRIDCDPLRTLLANKADFKARNAAGRTPLYAAARAGHWESVQVLAGLWPESISLAATDGSLPLHAAAGSGGIRAACTLLVAGAKAMAPDGQKRTPLQVALEAKDDRMALAIAAKAQAAGQPLSEDLSATIKTALADPLFTAISSGTTAAIGLLVKETPARLEQPIAGWSPLLWAVALGNVDAVRALRFAGALQAQPVDAYNGGTPLHYAVRDGSFDILKTLGITEAFVLSPDGAGKTPLGLAEEAGLSAMARYLRGLSR